jgi:hypothetical protein
MSQKSNQSGEKKPDQAQQNAQPNDKKEGQEI